MGRHLVYKSVTSHEHDIPTDLQDLQAFAQQVKSDYLAREARHKAEIQNRDMMITKLRHQLFGLRKDKFGSSGEGLDQLGLRLEDEETGQELNIATTESDVAEETAPKVKPVRRALPKHLPRTDVKHMPDAPCAGCGSELDDGAKALGEDVMEELEYVPRRFVVNRIIRPRLSCAACETISQAPMPSRPIPKSYAGPGLLASRDNRACFARLSRRQIGTILYKRLIGKKKGWPARHQYSGESWTMPISHYEKISQSTKGHLLSQSAERLDLARRETMSA